MLNKGKWNTEETWSKNCWAEVLWRTASVMLRHLRLDRPPRIAANVADRAREAWAKVAQELPALSSQGQHHNISSNQMLLLRRGSCVQISYHVTLDDLGWQTWVLHPNSFIITICLGCQCHRKEERSPTPIWIQECGLLEQPSHLPPVDSKQGRCCRPRRTPLPFTFLQEDGTLVVQAPRLNSDCHCQP
ncbi:growth/differentiation factor 15-like [Eublepharis macularius]|uniref:Growth/differentiation factor 15-like n=1 Tax=Eublepharis macularius TaxID=481883 RepID=A0AA97JXI8_EUBMA|nr:growth/differentiation factor 15-like [Eublepharis macularius]